MRRKTYLVLTFIFAGSLLLMVLPPVGEIGRITRELAKVPAIAALLGALFQLARDSIAFDRSILMQNLQNSFSIGATSHMAIVAFDKYVVFSEEYVSKVFETASLVLSKGPCQDALYGAQDLRAIRRKYALWITSQVEAELEKFEAALTEMGAAAHVVETAPGTPQHQKFVNQMYSKFAEVMGSKVMGSKEWDGKQITEQVALYTILHKLQEVLGVEDLNNLRATFIDEAALRKREA